MTTDAYPFEEGGHPWELKCWGAVQHVFDSPDVAVSVLKVNSGFRCSKHYHVHRINRFVVVSGRIIVYVWLPEADLSKPAMFGHVLNPEESVSVRAKFPHMFLVEESGIVVEIYTPYGGPVRINDIVRFDEGGPV